MKLIVISGLSGSGKSVALHTLEDVGYYCIDNLPVGLLAEFGRHVTETRGERHERYAVGIDVRSGLKDLSGFGDALERLQAGGIGTEVIFLQADDDTLIKRFSETRRRHPLSGPEVSLAEAIARETELLAPIHARADLTLDTTSTNVHQLRDLIRERLDRRAGGRLSLLFESFGFKHSIPKDADFVFDVRCLPNPHWEPRLRPYTGRDEPVATYLAAQPSVERMYEQIRDFIAEWLPAFERENRTYLTIAIGCTGGQHRSVYLAERLTAHFRSGDPMTVAVRHRELS